MTLENAGGNATPSAEVSEAQEALQAAEAAKRAPEKRNRWVSDVDKLATVKDTVSKSDGVNMLLDGVNTLVESLPVLVKALDEVAKIHPFISIATGAFKVVIELEVKRRDNDKKVKLLFLEMRNMMSALLQLQNIRQNHVGPDGMSIGARLESLTKRTASDIKECANACDTYSKKRLLVKVFKGPVWDDTLKGYIQLFTDRKAEFNFAVSIHTGMAVDRAHEKLDTLMSKMDLILEFFKRSVPPSQRSLDSIIEQVGGPRAALEKMDILQDLLDKERTYEFSLSSMPDQTVYVSGGRALSVASGGSARRHSHQGFNYSRSAETQRTRRRTFSANQMHASGSGRVLGGESHSGYTYGGTYSTPAYVNHAEYASTPAYVNHAEYASGPAAYPSSAPIPGRGPPPAPYSPGSDSPGRYRSRPGGGAVAIELEQEIQLLKQELLNTPAAEIKKNLEVFERKFEIQHREIVEDMRKIVVHEGDRIISSVLAGPHERIIDPDLYEIWRDMRWRGIVKARHLVLAIHDHYLQKLDDQEHDIQVDGTAKRRISDNDAWTLEYIDLMHLQPIIEALDEDASGYITIQEVNQFTTARPKGWSLLHWLAYWAIGWQVTVTAYKRKIDTLLGSMQEMIDKVRFPNQGKVARYLDVVRPIVDEITAGFQENTERLFLLPRFQAYVDQEETRLRRGLETTEYDLDALDTLALINGRKGLERNVFALVFLLMSHHHDIMKVAETHVIHTQELVDAGGSVLMIKDAFDLRRSDLSDLFLQRRLIVHQEIGEFACRMFDAPSPPSRITVIPDELSMLSTSTESPTPAILKYPTLLEDFYPDNEDGLQDVEDSDDVDELLKPIRLGRWAGAVGLTNFNLQFHISSTNREQLVAYPLLYYPWTCSRANFVAGCATGEDGDRTYTLTATFLNPTTPHEHFRLALSADGGTLTGDWDLSPDFTGPYRDRVIMKKNWEPEVMVCYPSPADLEENKARALWEFAISAVLRQIQQRTLSWTRIKARRDKRHRLASFFYRESFGGTLHPAEFEEKNELMSRVTRADMHYISYPALDPTKFPWILPPCQSNRCGKLLKTLVPCVRCCSCFPSAGYFSHGSTFCDAHDDPECLDDHLRTPLPILPHCVVKTRALEWSIVPFLGQLGVSAFDLTDRIMAVQQQLLKKDGLLTPVEDSAFSPHRLSTISEVTEDNKTEADEPGSGSSFGLGFKTTVSRRFQEVGEISLESAGSSPLHPNPGLPASSPVGSIAPSSSSDVTVFDANVGVLPATTDKLGNTSEALQTTPNLSCIGCNQEVSMPCWLCAECEDRVFVCKTCDEHSGITLDTHKDIHTLLFIYDPAFDMRMPTPKHSEDVPSGEDRWGSDGWGNKGRRNGDPSISWGQAANNWQGGASDTRLGEIEDRLTSIEVRFGAVEGRLVRMEGMLEAALSLLRAPQAPRPALPPASAAPPSETEL